MQADRQASKHAWHAGRQACMHAGRRGKQAGKQAGRQASRQAGGSGMAWQAGGSATDYRVIDYRSIIEGVEGRTRYGRVGWKGSGTEGSVHVYL